jgi:hypothetical protein
MNNNIIIDLKQKRDDNDPILRAAMSFHVLKRRPRRLCSNEHLREDETVTMTLTPGSVSAGALPSWLKALR